MIRTWLARAAVLAGWLPALVFLACGGGGRANRPEVGEEAAADEAAGESAEAFDPAALDYRYCPVDQGLVEATYERLSPRQRIGQHVITQIRRAGESVAADDERRLRTYFLGGAFVSQITGIAPADPVASARFLHHAQVIAGEAAGVPLFLSSDQEGGVYASVNHLTGGTDSLSPTALGATRDERVVFDQFDLMGREVRALGLNMNFGPLLDTHYQRDNGNLNTRTFGPDVDLNARLGVAAFAAFQRNLVLPAVKHFPGDGMLAVNTHHEYSVNTAPLEELEARLLKPFRAAFAAGSDAVMIIPAQYTALDDRRAAITSRPVITGFLRGEVGFEGLVVTDDLNMYGARLGLAEDQEPGYEALKAGADLLLYVSMDDGRLDDLFARIEAGLASGDLDADGFAASTRRILGYKQKYCLFAHPTYPEEEDVDRVRERVGLAGDAARALGWAEQAVVTLTDDSVLPLQGRRVLCVGPGRSLPDPASGWSWLLEESFCQVLKRIDPSAQALDFVVGSTEGSVPGWVEARRDGADVLVMATFQGYFSPEQQGLLDGLLGAGGLPVVHVAQGVAFDALQTRDRASAVVLLQGGLPVMFEAGVRVLYGDAQAGGRLLYGLEP
jgi:beta-N-acetylhexosaminidase